MSWDGRIYDKYKVEHVDGTPLKGKKYFVLRLDSDDPVEAARVAAAMRAYKGEPKNGDMGTAKEQSERYNAFCYGHRSYEAGCGGCPLIGEPCCELAWAQLPYEAGGGKDTACSRR